jgi:hypothetical protein
MRAGTENTPFSDDTVLNVLACGDVLDDDVGSGNHTAIGVDDDADTDAVDWAKPVVGLTTARSRIVARIPRRVAMTTSSVGRSE